MTRKCPFQCITVIMGLCIATLWIFPLTLLRLVIYTEGQYYTAFKAVLTWCVAINAVTLILNAVDKYLARCDCESCTCRVPEAVLHTFTLLGGGAAAVIAMFLFCHKFKKASYHRCFLAVALYSLIFIGGAYAIAYGIEFSCTSKFMASILALTNCNNDVSTHHPITFIEYNSTVSKKNITVEMRFYTSTSSSTKTTTEIDLFRESNSLKSSNNETCCTPKATIINFRHKARWMSNHKATARTMDTTIEAKQKTHLITSRRKQIESAFISRQTSRSNENIKRKLQLLNLCLRLKKISKFKPKVCEVWMFRFLLRSWIQSFDSCFGCDS